MADEWRPGPDPARREGGTVRTVVVGASSGLGRCIGIDRARRGDQVAFLARRAERIEAAAQEAGEGSVAVVCDVTDDRSCAEAIQSAADALGGIDALVYSAGVGPLQPIEQISAATWRQALDINVVGAALATAASLPHLQASHGVAVYLSSVSASMGRPWPGMGAYTVSKSALDRLIEAYRVEHPEVGFTRVVVGDCVGGEGDGQTELPTASGWDMDVAVTFMDSWAQRGYFTGYLMDVEELLAAVEFVVRTRAAVPSISVIPRADPAQTQITTSEATA
jgi:NAD(P)-dependent dehydrogenase (short-subunit alcohol dehydrogenase family)